MARPADALAKINPEELTDLLTLYPSIEEVADWFGVSKATVRRFIKRNFKCSFDTLRDQKFVKTRIALRRKQLEQALKKGNTALLIFLGKALLGQADRPEAEGVQRDDALPYKPRKEFA